MSTYKVITKEVYVWEVEVKADNQEQAKYIALHGPIIDNINTDTYEEVAGPSSR